MNKRKVILMLLVISLVVVANPSVRTLAKDNQLLELIISEAKQGNVKLQYYLGSMYLEGTEFNQDYEQAIKWFKKAAYEGDSSSQYQLGRIYENGLGVKKDTVKAMNWYKKSACQPKSNSNFTLSKFKDFNQAKKKLAGETVNKAEKIHEIISSELKKKGQKIEKTSPQMILFLTLVEIMKQIDDKSTLSNLELTGDNYLLAKPGKVLAYTNKKLAGKNYANKSFFRQMKQTPDGKTIANIKLNSNVVAADYLIHTTQQKGFIIFFSRIADLGWYYVTQVQIW